MRPRVARPKAGAQGWGPGRGRAVVHMREAREVDADGYIDDAEEGEVGALAHQPRDEVVRDDEAAARGEGRVEGVGPLLGRHVRPARRARAGAGGRAGCATPAWAACAACRVGSSAAESARLRAWPLCSARSNGKPLTTRLGAAEAPPACAAQPSARRARLRRPGRRAAALPRHGTAQQQTRLSRRPRW